MFVRVLLVAVGMGHGWLTYQSWSRFGYAGFFPPFSDVNTLQIFSDLVISASFVHVLLARDLHARRRSPLWNIPWLLATGLSGSWSPILYFIWRPEILQATFRMVSGGGEGEASSAP